VKKFAEEYQFAGNVALLETAVHLGSSFEPTRTTDTLYSK